MSCITGDAFQVYGSAGCVTRAARVIKLPRLARLNGAIATMRTAVECALLIGKISDTIYPLIRSSLECALRRSSGELLHVHCLADGQLQVSQFHSSPICHTDTHARKIFLLLRSFQCITTEQLSRELLAARVKCWFSSYHSRKEYLPRDLNSLNNATAPVRLDYHCYSVSTVNYIQASGCCTV